MSENIKINIKYKENYLLIASILIGAGLYYITNNRVLTSLIQVLVTIQVVQYWWCRYSANHIQIDYKELEPSIEKDSIVKCEVVVTNTGRIHTPNIALVGIEFPILELEQPKVYTMLKPNEKQTLTINYKSRLSGEAIIGVQSYQMYAPLYMGMDYVREVKMPLQKTSILPRGKASYSEQSKYSVELEEEMHTLRPYVYGDTMREIDWKVWAKTDTMFIKKRGYIPQPIVNQKGDKFILDCYLPKEDFYKNRDRYVELFLFRIKQVFNQKQQATAILFDGSSWREYIIDSEQRVEELRLALVKVGFESDKKTAKGYLEEVSHMGEVFESSQIVA